jgi:hypothetical protein
VLDTEGNVGARLRGIEGDEGAHPGIHALLLKPGQGVAGNQAAHAGPDQRIALAGGNQAVDLFQQCRQQQGIALDGVGGFVEVQHHGVEALLPQGFHELLLVGQFVEFLPEHLVVHVEALADHHRPRQLRVAGSQQDVGTAAGVGSVPGIGGVQLPDNARLRRGQPDDGEAQGRLPLIATMPGGAQADRLFPHGGVRYGDPLAGPVLGKTGAVVEIPLEAQGRFGAVVNPPLPGGQLKHNLTPAMGAVHERRRREEAPGLERGGLQDPQAVPLDEHLARGKGSGPHRVDLHVQQGQGNHRTQAPVPGQPAQLRRRDPVRAVHGGAVQLKEQLPERGGPQGLDSLAPVEVLRRDEIWSQVQQDAAPHQPPVGVVEFDPPGLSGAGTEQQQEHEPPGGHRRVSHQARTQHAQPFESSQGSG